MHEPGYLRDVFLEEPKGVGVGHHHAGDIIAQKGLEVVDIHQSFRSALHLYDLQPAYCGRGRIGSMGRVGHDDFLPFGVAALLVVGRDDHQTCQLSVCPGVGVECDIGHAGDGGQCTLYTVFCLQCALHSLSRL